MKTIAKIALAACMLQACNNDKETRHVEHSGTDTTLKVTADQPAMDSSGASTATADEASSNFLMKAAEGGNAELAASKNALSRTMNSRVKMFADMMVMDHSNANQKVKELALQLRVDIPGTPSAEQAKKLEEASKKEGKAFDKAYMDMMVNDHKKTISLFKENATLAGNADVKQFINGTLPKLEAHLDSALAIQKSL